MIGPGSGVRVYLACGIGLQPHQPHQATDTMTASVEPTSGQVGCDLAAAEERVFSEHSVNLVHQFQSLSVSLMYSGP